MEPTLKTENKIEYIGDELDLFKEANNWKTYFSSKISKYISGDVLEVGAGIGVNTSYLSEKLPQINSWTWVEPDSVLCSQIFEANQKMRLSNQRIINGTIDSLTNEKYDTIIYIDVLEHIEDSSLEIKKIKSHLRTNGTLIIIVPAYQCLYNEFDKSIGHFRRYSKGMITREIAGELRKKELFYLDSVSVFASIANKIFLKKTTPSISDVRFWDKVLVPISKITDLLCVYSFGKSLVGVYTNE